MSVLVRASASAALFIRFLIVFVPARLLSWSGVSPPATMGLAQVIAMLLGAAGASLALWCIATFVFAGKGTPAPFDPPRQLVVRGPYGVVRNPMYLGAGLALAGAALFYQSGSLAVYAALFLLCMHLFVVAYEEPTLRRTFGEAYEAYCRRIRRWWPTL